MYVADMYIKVTQYDKMQRAFVGDSPCMYFYMTTFSLVTSAYECIYFKNQMYVTFCCLHGKTIRTNCNLKVAFSLNSWIYNKKGKYTVDCTIPKYIWTRAQMTTIFGIYFGIVQSTV